MDSDILGDIIDFDSEIEYIRNWITQRIIYLDKKFLYYMNSSVKDVTAEQKSNEINIYTLQGQKIKTPQKGIFIMNGKKVIF